ncbi:hypothetical protein JHD48_08515 [Sulfurimonas sp. SAG-AH-194-I05]|nr:hypothetical protein [Sulfurimonas sp. SAG-AH-194-I05]MDF1875777.1 hypothetical protein [Sulfurimonas sp. SAG-AH-194-I05]
MKKMLFILFVLPLAAFAQSFLISNIPVPKTYIQNLDPYACDEWCMQNYINNEMIFSFLAHAQSKLDNEEQDEMRMMYISILNLGSTINSDKIKIALLLPYKRIGKYASSTTNAAFAYLITKNKSFELKSYKIENENIDAIKKALTNIKNDGFSHVIAPLTKKGAFSVAQINPSINIFFPTINKKNTDSNSSYLHYGGIDYEAQSDLLLKEAIAPLVIFYDKSSLGKKLALYEEHSFQYETLGDENATDEYGALIKPKTIKIPERKVIKFSIPRGTTNLQRYLKNNKDINNSTSFINTPIIKTSMIMSQLTLYDTNTTRILSTQINYDPLILSMTQYIDRKKMIIANSITEHNNILTETNAILSNDIEYDWINYTTTIGVDYFFSILTNEEREYNVDFIDQQMVYPIELLKPSISRFIKYTPTLKHSEY